MIQYTENLSHAVAMPPPPPIRVHAAMLYVSAAIKHLSSSVREFGSASYVKFLVLRKVRPRFT